MPETTERRTYAGVAHIIPQRYYHQPAFIVGDRAGLEQIRDAINEALLLGEANRGTFTHDGEGYGVHVLCLDRLDDVPYGYTDKMCGDNGPWTDAMIRSVKNANRDRPADTPVKCECVECGCSFTGQDWHILCRVCVEPLVRKITKEQAEWTKPL